MNEDFTFGSLFAGIGGIDLGLERAGWTCKWQVENDPFCRSILSARFPHAVLYGSIKRRRQYPAVKLLAGGFPCQPVSHAGRRLAEKDPRWLWPQMLRVIRSLQPEWVLIENVEGLRTRGLGAVLKGLAESGYDAEWDCIPAAAFGAPHQRYRYFIVAYPASARFGASQRVFRPHQEASGEWEADQLGACGEIASYANGARFQRFGAKRKLRQVEKEVSVGRFGWWRSEPDVGRVANGVPDRVDRLKALGNAVVPQAAEWIGKRIIEAEAEGR